MGERENYLAVLLDSFIIYLYSLQEYVPVMLSFFPGLIVQSWLRVAQKLHTIDQVVVGAVLGSCFSVAWLWSWDAVVSEAFNSYMWVQVSILLASAICCMGFLLYVILNWFQKDR